MPSSGTNLSGNYDIQQRGEAFDSCLKFHARLCENDAIVKRWDTERPLIRYLVFVLAEFASYIIKSVSQFLERSNFGSWKDKHYMKISFNTETEK